MAGRWMCRNNSPESRRMLRIFWGCYLSMMVFYSLEHGVLNSRSSGWWYVVACGFAGSFAAALWAFGLMAYRQKDEFFKALLAQAMMWGSAVTMTLALVWGFLETSGRVPRVPLIYVPFAFVMLTTFIFGGMRIQNRTASE